MTRSKLDLSDFNDITPSRDPTILREISDKAGFPSRPVVQPALAVEPASVREFQRPARPTANRTIAINARVEPEIAQMFYELRDADPARRRTLADVMGDAIKLLYEREIGISNN